MASPLQPIQGMSDIVTPEVTRWQAVEARARHIFACYGYDEIRTPAVEYTGLFTRSLGESTDVVQKEMYTFEDRGGRKLSLRPEGTAGVIRYVAGLGPNAVGARLYYMGPMFRCERPQAGRKRQFHQLGAECIGSPNPAADAEMLALQVDLLAAWGLNGASVQINTRGVPEDRKAVASGLMALLAPHRERLCEDCRRRFETNILRVLDCKEEACRAVVDAAPAVTSFMGEDSRRYLDEVKRWLETMGIEARVNPRLVRGLDYYVHTVWEISHAALGAQNALAGGGRYQIQMGAATIEGVGFAMGMERVITALAAQSEATPAGKYDVWLVALGAGAFEYNLTLARRWRAAQVRVGMEMQPGSMKSQMRAANRSGAPYAVICGEDELARGVVVLKQMSDGTQRELPAAEVPAALKS